MSNFIHFLAFWSIYAHFLAHLWFQLLLMLTSCFNYDQLHNDIQLFLSINFQLLQVAGVVLYLENCLLDIQMNRYLDEWLDLKSKLLGTNVTANKLTNTQMLPMFLLLYQLQTHCSMYTQDITNISVSQKSIITKWMNFLAVGKGSSP